MGFSPRPKFFPHPNGNPIALPGRRSKQIAGNPGPGVPEAGQRPDPAREERPRGPRSPLTRMPPAAAAATAPAAPPRAGHVAAGHAVARSVCGADSEGPRLSGRFCPAGQGRPLLSEFRGRVVPGRVGPGGGGGGWWETGPGDWFGGRERREGDSSLLPGMQSPGLGFWDQVFRFGGEAGKEEQNRFL